MKNWNNLDYQVRDVVQVIQRALEVVFESSRLNVLVQTANAVKTDLPCAMAHFWIDGHIIIVVRVFVRVISANFPPQENEIKLER